MGMFRSALQGDIALVGKKNRGSGLSFRGFQKPKPYTPNSKGGFPKIRDTILGVPIVRTIVFWGLYWGPLILGNYQALSPKLQGVLRSGLEL